ncbi:MAG: ATP-binding protein [Actinomycetia bacterium]|nr:ATP-binding protein [Actinomycetes bacterium]
MPDSRTSYDVFQVFTPTTQAKINFVERHSLNERVVDALRTPGKQVVIYGETGSGKSTLLSNKLDQLYEAQITTRCQNLMTFEQLIIDAFDQLAPFYVEGGSFATEASTRSTLGADFRAIRAQVEVGKSVKSGSDLKRVLPPQLTPQRLGQFLGERKICWVLEDFHKVAKAEKTALSQSLKVFCDLAQAYPQVKIVALGATDSAREVVEYDPEMANRVAEIHVPLMTDVEIFEILSGGEQLLNIDFGTLKDLIVTYSVGVAAICHQLALNMCTTRGVNETSEDKIVFDASDLQAALKKYIDDQSDTLKSRFDKALRRMRVKKYDNCQIILRVMATGDPDGMLHSEILAEVRKVHPKYPPSNLTTYLRALQSEDRGAVLKSSNAGRYSFTDPYHYLFCHLLLTDVSGKKGLSEDALADALFKETLDKMVLTFSSTNEIFFSRPIVPNLNKQLSLSSFWRFSRDGAELTLDLGEAEDTKAGPSET